MLAYLTAYFNKIFAEVGGLPIEVVKEWRNTVIGTGALACGSSWFWYQIENTMIVFSSILSQSKESRPTGRTYVSRSGECQRKTLEFLARTPDKILAFPLTQNKTAHPYLRFSVE